MNTLTVPIARPIDRCAVQQRRVLVITYLFPPGMEMGAQACAQISRYLPLYGWTPVVLTVRERYCEHLDPQVDRAFPGPVLRTGVVPHPFIIYRRLKSRLAPTQGTAGHGTAPASKLSLRSRVLSLLGVPDTYTGWIPMAVSRGLAAVRRYRVQHLFSSGPPWTAHLVGLALARLSGLPWTAHFRDPWIGPRSEMQRLKPVSALSARMEAALERMVVRRATVVVCVTDEHRALLARTYPEVTPRKFVAIPNGFDGLEWERIERHLDGRTRREEGTFVITYAGTLYNRRNPLPLFRALRKLIDAGEVTRERIRVDLVGWCDAAENRRVGKTAEDCGLAGQVSITGPLSRAETLGRMVRSNLLLLLAEGLTLQVPGKTYEYIRAGRPILALAAEGAVAHLLRTTGGAWVVDPTEETGIAGAIREAYQAWERGQVVPVPDRHRVSSFDRRVLAGRFAELFDQTVSGAHT